MTLLRLQRELAALLMEEPARQAFAAGKRRYARQRGLTGQDARLLASLDASDVGYFASRRAIDRRGALRLDLGRTTALLEQGDGLFRYFRAHPYALEDPVREARRLAAWAVQAARRGQVPALAADLARYEAADLALRGATPRAARPSRHPRRAPHVVLLRVGHDLERALEEDGPLEAEVRPAQVVLWRGPDGVHGGEVPAVVAEVLRRADGRTSEAALVREAARASKATVARAKRALAELRKEGLLSPALRA